MKNSFRIQNTNLYLGHGYLNELKCKLKNKYPQLTDTDFISSEGNENDVLRMIEYKLGKTKQEMRKIIVEL